MASLMNTLRRWPLTVWCETKKLGSHLAVGQALSDQARHGLLLQQERTEGVGALDEEAALLELLGESSLPRHPGVGHCSDATAGSAS
jgi:hypothetical protein